MKWLKKLFNKNRQLEIEPVPPMPSWDKIVELLYDKNLDSFCDEVINVFYSKDKSMRYVVLKDKNITITGTHTYNTLPQSSIVPSSNNQLVNKKYVDDSIANSITDALQGGY